MKRVVLYCAVLLWMSATALVHAHEVRPGYLELRQTGEEVFQVMWKVPAREDSRLAIYPRLPESCTSPAPISSYKRSGAYINRWQVTCTGGLSGKIIAIDGLSATLTDALVRFERLDGTTQLERLLPASTSFVVDAASAPLKVAGTYLHLGVEHILFGIDHLLFVLALLFLVVGTRRLVWTITAFTVAHSLTLAAATLGFVHVIQAPVEAIIALSIVFVAGEIVHARQGCAGITQRWPWIVAFTFGLLHGFGFAGALTEVGLPEQSIPLALLFFNVGVELGQLLFITTVGLLFLLSRRLRLPQSTRAWRFPVYGIGGIGAFWLIERVAGFWG